MTKSEAGAANELVTQLEKDARERLLPEKGADFAIAYYDGDKAVTYGEAPYTWVNAVSQGLRVVCYGPEFRVSLSKQRKPILPDFFKADDGSYRRALRIAINGDDLGNNADFYIHILGELVVVSKDKLNCARMVNDESLTPSDRAIMDQIREKK